MKIMNWAAKNERNNSREVIWLTFLLSHTHKHSSYLQKGSSMIGRNLPQNCAINVVYSSSRVPSYMFQLDCHSYDSDYRSNVH
uniref:Uncharacterized protein n=1 Tax=Parascaris univalens TaxID=6257 RepID=A0A915AL15_PARUN